MRENVKISKIDRKKRNKLKKYQIFTKPNETVLSSREMSQNER